MNVTSPQIELLSNLLDSTALRAKVIANNVANVNTPGYKRLDLTFEETFSRIIQPGGAQLPGHATIVEDPDAPERVDGNTVDIDQEMNNLNKNTLLYETLTQILTGRIASLRSAITGT